MNHTIGITYFAIFCIFLIIVAVWSAKQNKAGKKSADEEYFLGGHATPLVVLAVSYCASAVSAGSFMGDPGMMSVVGWPYYWLAVFAVPGLVIPGIFVIRKMRLQAQRYGSMTITEYIGHRFNSPGLKLYLSVVIVLCYLFMLVSQFKAAAILLEMFTGLNFTVGLIIMCVVSLVYVNIGGLRSVAWTDFIQGLLMCIMCVVLLAVGLNVIGGFPGGAAIVVGASPRRIIRKQVQRDDVCHHVDLNVIVVPIGTLRTFPTVHMAVGQHAILIESRRLSSKIAPQRRVEILLDVDGGAGLLLRQQCRDLQTKPPTLCISHLHGDRVHQHLLLQFRCLGMSGIGWQDTRKKREFLYLRGKCECRPERTGHVLPLQQTASTG